MSVGGREGSVRLPAFVFVQMQLLHLLLEEGDGHGAAGPVRQRADLQSKGHVRKSLLETATKGDSSCFSNMKVTGHLNSIGDRCSSTGWSPSQLPQCEVGYTQNSLWEEDQPEDMQSAHTDPHRRWTCGLSTFPVNTSPPGGPLQASSPFSLMDGTEAGFPSCPSSQVSKLQDLSVWSGPTAQNLRCYFSTPMGPRGVLLHYSGKQRPPLPNLTRNK